MKLCAYPGALVNKDIPIKYNSNDEKTVETIDEIAKWSNNEA